MSTLSIPVRIDDPTNARILAISEDKIQGFQTNPFGEISRLSGVELPLVIERIRAMLAAGSIRPDGSTRIGGAVLNEREVRKGLEKTCRALARYAPTRAEKIALIDKANEYRPLTLT